MRELLGVEAEDSGNTPSREGTKEPFMRSRCRRSIITMSAPARPFAHVGEHLDAHALDARRQQRRRRRRPAPRAPSAFSRMMLERATRECRMSPQIATTSPSMRPLLRRMVSASSSAWVGCSCAPSPALTTEQSTLLGEQMHRAGCMVAHDDDVRPHGVQRHGRVDQRLALLHGGRRDRHVHHVGAEPLAGELEGGLRPRRGLEEEVDLRAAAQGRLLLLDLAATRRPPRRPCRAAT